MNKSDKVLKDPEITNAYSGWINKRYLSESTHFIYETAERAALDDYDYDLKKRSVVFVQIQVLDVVNKEDFVQPWADEDLETYLAA